jgi:hypothetical protein
MTHLEKNNRLSRHQHGFRPKRGCHSNLIEMWEKSIDKVDKHGPTIEMWSFDLQKAFDLLDHGKALTLCHMAGINGFVGKCLENWLVSRKQYIQCGLSKSEDRIVNKSCVQGSVLGPTIWLIYVQSLLDRLEDRCDFFAYANDVAIIKKISTTEEKEDFEGILQILLEWGREYGMKWGANKTQRMAHRYQNSGGKTPMEILFNGNTIRPTETLESLGILFSKECIPYAQIERVRSSVRTMRTLIRKNYRIRTPEIMLRLYKTYILPRISYYPAGIFKKEIKDTLIKNDRRKQHFLNFGLNSAISGAPPGIHE